MFVSSTNVALIRKYHSYNWNIDTIAEKVGVRGIVVRNVLANKE